MCDKKVRRSIKTASGRPTIPPSSDHRNGDWIDTDVYDGELYMDTDTGRLYTANNGVIVPASLTSSIFSEYVNDTQSAISDSFVSFSTSSAINMPPMSEGDRLLIKMICSNTTAPALNGFGMYVFLDNEAYAHPAASTPTYSNSFIQLPTSKSKCMAEIEVVKVSSTSVFLIVKSTQIDGSFVATLGKQVYYQEDINTDDVTEIVPQAFISAGGSITLDYFSVTHIIA